MDEFEADLDLCNNSSPGMDGIKLNIYKALPIRVKEISLGFLNGIRRTGKIPEKWHLTIWKPGKSSATSDSYRPISLIGCDRKLMEIMLCTRLDI
jgi:hypothetical protein